MQRTILRAGLALLIVGLAGCGAARPIKYYALDVPAGPPVGANSSSITLLVGRLNAPHVFRDDRIVYRTSPAELGAYEYHRWAEPPTEMLEAVLVRMLRASGKYRSVQNLRSNARGDFILRGRLQDFEEVSGQPSRARLAVEIDLYEQKTGTTLWSHFYSHDEPVNGKDMSAVVEALSRNAQRGLGEVIAGLDEYFTKNPPREK